jgi:hypothetical protein
MSEVLFVSSDINIVPQPIENIDQGTVYTSALSIGTESISVKGPDNPGVSLPVLISGSQTQPSNSAGRLIRLQNLVGGIDPQTQFYDFAVDLSSGHLIVYCGVLPAFSIDPKGNVSITGNLGVSGSLTVGGSLSIANLTVANLTVTNHLSAGPSSSPESGS